MDYTLLLNDLVNDFEKQFDFYLLKNNYVFSSDAKKFLDTYKLIKKDQEIPLETKYEKLNEHLKNAHSVAINIIKNLKDIHILEPNYQNVFNLDVKYYEVNLSVKSKFVCEAIKNLFKDEEIRKHITNEELYNLYFSYYLLSEKINDKSLTVNDINKIEENLQSITKKMWQNYLTPVTDYKEGESFHFLIHNASKTDLEGTTLNEHYGRKGRISTSLITDQQMGVYGRHRYGFIYPPDTKIITAGYRDIYSYETLKEGNFSQNDSNSSLLAPNAINQYCIEKTIENNGEILNRDNANIYNEVLIDATNIKPVGIFCLTFGEKDLSEDYVSAKNLAEKNNLPLIEIDISLYRTKNNIGYVYTDREPLTLKEQDEFVKKFLSQYYRTKNYDINLQYMSIEADYQKYHDMIIDMFLDLKQTGKVSKETLFKLYETKINEKRDKGDEFNVLINEQKDLKEAFLSFKEALDKSQDENLSKEIEIKLKEIISRIKKNNTLIKNNNDINLSNNNPLLQHNPLVDKMLSKFTPFVIEKITYEGELIPIITSYKETQEITEEQDKMLEELALNNNDILPQYNHARRKIMAICNGYKTNSLINSFAYYKKQNPELEELKALAKKYLDMVDFQEKKATYDSLVNEKNLLEQKIAELKEKEKILSGQVSYKWVLEKERSSAVTIKELENYLNLANADIDKLQQEKNALEKKQAKLNSQNFIKRFLKRKERNQNNTQIINLKSLLEQKMVDKEAKERTLKDEKGFSNYVVNQFLTSYGSPGMSLADYKIKLDSILSDEIETFNYVELNSALEEINKKLEDLDLSAMEREVTNMKQ